MTGLSNIFPPWLEHLTGEELSFVRRFVLCSGSLKEMARQYSVSYPTIRLRLDRLIEKIKLVERTSAGDRFERSLKMAFDQGKVDQDTMSRLLEAYRLEKERDDENKNQ